MRGRQLGVTLGLSYNNTYMTCPSRSPLDLAPPHLTDSCTYVLSLCTVPMYRLVVSMYVCNNCIFTKSLTNNPPEPPESPYYRITLYCPPATHYHIPKNCTYIPPLSSPFASTFLTITLFSSPLIVWYLEKNIS